MKTLVLTAHPNLETSRINRAWFEALSEADSVTTRNLTSVASDTMQFDVDVEQALLLEHDRIVFQFPLYWYSSPPVLKAWIDQVLTYEFAYGPKGDKLKGRELLILVSTGGPEDSYHAGGYNSFSIDEFLKPFQQTANLTGLTFLRPFVAHGLVSASQEDIEAGIPKMLAHITDPELDPKVKLARLLSEIENDTTMSEAIS